MGDIKLFRLQGGKAIGVRHIGHWGTGDFEVTVRTMDALERRKPLIFKSYEVS